MGVVYVGIHVSRYLKEEQTWATDKRLGIINKIQYSYTTKELKIKLLSLK